MGNRHSEAGVTLLEILIVLVIVGVMAGMVSIAAGVGGSKNALSRASDLMASRLTLVAERAALTGEDAAIAWDTDGYRFLQYRDGTWAPYRMLSMEADERLGTVHLDGAASPASAIISADLGASDSRPLRWVMESGADRVDVVFDGLSAWTEPAR